MQTLLLLSASIVLALACPPGTGTPNTKGVFKFTIYPPLGWTYKASSSVTIADAVSNKVAANKNAAMKTATDEIKAAIKTSLEEYGYGSVSFTVELSYVPTEIKKELAQTCKIGDYAYYGNTVYYKCDVQTTAYGDNTVSGKATISTSQQLYDNQWDAVAVKVQKKLQAKGVVFDSSLEHDGH